MYGEISVHPLNTCRFEHLYSWSWFLWYSGNTHI